MFQRWLNVGLMQNEGQGPSPILAPMVYTCSETEHQVGEKLNYLI